MFIFNFIYSCLNVDILDLRCKCYARVYSVWYIYYGFKMDLDEKSVIIN